MKKQLNPNMLPLLTLGLGGLALALRGLLYRFGTDSKGLLISWHPLGILLGLVTVAALGLIVTQVLPLKGSNRYADNYSPSMPGAVGSFLAAGGIVLTVFAGLADPVDLPNLLWILLGLLAAGSLIFAGLARLQGKRPVFLFHCLVCLFFAIHMVSQYRHWSGHPQLQDYLFPLLACIALMLAAYYRAAFDVGFGRRRMQLAVSLIAVFLCCVCLSGGNRIFFLTCGAWCVTNLCSLTPTPRRRRPLVEETAPDPTQDAPGAPE